MSRALLGYGVYQEGDLIPLADLTGIYGVSVLVVFVNTMLYWLLSAAANFRAKALGLAATVGGYPRGGCLRKDSYPSDPSGAGAKDARIAIVQGNIPQSLKWNPDEVAIKVYSDASEAAARQGVDLIIWPETAATFVFQPTVAYRWGLQDHARILIARLSAKQSSERR